MLLNDEPTNVVISLFVTNNRLRIDYALEAQHSLKRKKSFNNDQKTTAKSAIKNKKDANPLRLSIVLSHRMYRS